jgi:hypothetical protein
MAVMGFSNPTNARPDFSNLAFHPVSLATVSDQRRSPFDTGAKPADTAVLPPPGARLSPEDTWRLERSSIAKYEQAIAAAQSKHGPYAHAISEQAMALGLLLQRTGDQQAALKAFERSMHVLRVNTGLFSSEQVPVMKAIINSHIQLGDVANAHAMQEALFNLQRKQHGQDQLALVPALLEWADWNVNLYLVQGMRHADMLTLSAAQLSSALHDPRLSLAYSSYSEALQILARQTAVPDERLVSTERKLAALNFMINRELQDTYGAVAGYMERNPDYNSPGQVLEQANSALFFAGSDALKRAIEHSYNVPEPDYDAIAARMMELGDWYLLFDRRAAALEIYADALQVMQEARLPQEDVERIMSPGMPVQTPDTTLLAVTPPPSERFAGFIDVQFELSRFGMAMNPQIIASSGADRHIEKDLLRTIRGCKFRPKFVAGNATNDQKIQLRYYYTL